jgi:ADP-dependent NAD(P)H-hydrate dehydratase / NAD(P)H-hydrate epimerase
MNSKNKVILTKWDRGRVVICGGSLGTSFSVNNACLGAMRSGAGLVVAVVPSELAQSLDGKSLYKVVNFLDYKESLPMSIFDLIRKSNVFVAGMGIEKDLKTISIFFKKILKTNISNIIIDADLCRAIAEDMSLLRVKKTSNCLLILNIRETEAIFNKKKPSLKKVVSLCKKFKIKILIKGKKLKLIDKTGLLYSAENDKFPEIALAGTGDFLSGLIGGLLAQNMSFVESVSTAFFLRNTAVRCYLHKTGDIIAYPSDIIKEIPRAWKFMKQRKEA